MRNLGCGLLCVWGEHTRDSAGEGVKALSVPLKGAPIGPPGLQAVTYSLTSVPSILLPKITRNNWGGSSLNFIYSRRNISQ